MTGAILLWLSLAALAVACLAAIATHALRDFSRGQLRELLRARDQVSWYEEIVEQHRQAALGAESLRVLLSGAAVFTAARFWWSNHPNEAGWPAELLRNTAEVIGGGIILWLAIVSVPTTVARLWPEAFIARTWPIWRLGGKLLAPSMAGTERVEGLLNRITGKSQHLTELELEEDIREVVTEGQREGLIEDEAREMIESVIALGEVKVSEIMTPRTDAVVLPADLGWEEAVQQVLASGHTRFPIYSSSPDQIIGILHIKDMLQEMARGPNVPRRSISELLRPPFFVPESKSVDTLLNEFQHSRNHIAIVSDEFGGVSGLITIEDVLEEIVGEISDEYDDVSGGDRIKRIDEHAFETPAQMHISEINEHLGLHLPEDEHFDTIGGFVFHQLGRIPHVGEELKYDGVRIKVLETTRRRIIRLAIEVLPPENIPATGQAEMEVEKPGA